MSAAKTKMAPAPDQTQGSVLAVTLPPEKADMVPAVVDKYDFPTLPGSELVLFGQEPVSSFSRQLDQMLDDITKADSPILFELFRKLSGSVKEMDIPKLEADIREKLSGGWFSRVLHAFGLGSKARRLEEAADEIRELLRSKASSLLDLVRPMEKQVSEESAKLVLEINRLGQQAEAYRENILDLGVYVLAGRKILEGAKSQQTQIENEAESTKDPLKVRDAKDFRTKVDLFENRLLALETAYAKAPVDLESIGLTQSAGLMTLADTISSSQTEFNDIKSALLRLHALFKIKSIQQLNQLRRNLREELQQYSISQLEQVAITATTSAADARLQDAQILTGIATALTNISAKVEAEREKNKEKHAATRELLVQVQQSVASLKTPAETDGLK